MVLEELLLHTHAGSTYWAMECSTDTVLCWYSPLATVYIGLHSLLSHACTTSSLVMLVGVLLLGVSICML